MKKDCMLIATVPSLNDMKGVEKVFSNPYVSELRFNTGVKVAYSESETLDILKALSVKYNKRIWIDIKGRQLRVSAWANPLYSCIELNHKIKVTYPAKVYFRNGDRVNITSIEDGNKLFVYPLPKEALGAGQSVNIIAESVDVDTYLTMKDVEYLKTCKEKGLVDIMASFVEEAEDLSKIYEFLPNANIVSKIESIKGINFILNSSNLKLMAARDDLYLQCGEGYDMINHLRTIISKDKDAICASKIFSSLEKRMDIDFADYADLELMYIFGYKKFMLCDNICNRAFEKAIKGWEEFING